jgi:very-short-patch-repair endonuclease
MVDAVWRRQRVVVELDGQAAHGEATRVEHDRGREFKLRGAGWIVLRYGWRLITQEGERVAADLGSALRLQPTDHGRTPPGMAEARRR